MDICNIKLPARTQSVLVARYRDLAPAFLPSNPSPTVSPATVRRERSPQLQPINTCSETDCNKARMSG